MSSCKCRHKEDKLIETLFEALDNLMRVNTGFPKDCGHAFDCVCPTDKARAALAEYHKYRKDHPRVSQG